MGAKVARDHQEQDRECARVALPDCANAQKDAQRKNRAIHFDERISRIDRPATQGGKVGARQFRRRRATQCPTTYRTLKTARSIISSRYSRSPTWSAANRPQLIRDAAVKLLVPTVLFKSRVRSSCSKTFSRYLPGDPENGVAGCDRIASADLIDELVSRPDRPWSEYSKGRPITQNQLARLLKDFGVYSRTIRKPRCKTPKGYLDHQFKDAFERYLAQGAPNSRK